jgi:eukaryotic-like serine/threonine-protein kinase
MATAIRLTVVTGPHKDRTFCYCGPTRCQAGRAFDCFIQFAGTERDKLISRYHCQMEIDPPFVQVRDLGSRNGTYINGKKVDLDPQEISDLPHPEKPGALVNHGDLITLGGTTLQIEVVDCPHAKDAEGKPGWEGVNKDCLVPCTT